MKKAEIINLQSRQTGPFSCTNVFFPRQNSSIAKGSLKQSSSTNFYDSWMYFLPALLFFPLNEILLVFFFFYFLVESYENCMVNASCVHTWPMLAHASWYSPALAMAASPQKALWGTVTKELPQELGGTGMDGRRPSVLRELRARRALGQLPSSCCLQGWALGGRPLKCI